MLEAKHSLVVAPDRIDCFVPRVCRIISLAGSLGASGSETLLRSRSLRGEASMVSSDLRVTAYYQQQAAECEALAFATSSPRTRAIMLGMARRWRAFAKVSDGKELLQSLVDLPRAPTQ